MTRGWRVNLATQVRGKPPRIGRWGRQELTYPLNPVGLGPFQRWPAVRL